ncbi:MAG: 3-ketoacyl-ACP reductase [Pseudonocardia sp. SCN 72-86]|nr:MAG: 3-ketoacyl-ACP reductase [Pseudonocardia sp. SCN 72-86]
MTGRVTGKVALVTGAARGQGRSHAMTLAREGADVVLVDRCADYESVDYPMASTQDLDATAKEIEVLDRRAVAVQADVRDIDTLKAQVDDAVAVLGRLDVVVANAGICVLRPWDEVTPQIWRDALDTNLTGVWNTMIVTIPHLKAAGGGSIISTGSTTALKGAPFFAPYVAAKHGLVGLSEMLANELGQDRIRVNTVHPTGVKTVLTQGLAGLDNLIERNPTLGPIFWNTLPVRFVEPEDVSNAVLYLASDESRHVTGLSLTVDAGNTIR